ncbi:hypothetical protein [[Kitasatospora] papulosa]|uniref:hypothetical protein n=1 Tax=[Kitasatospora] papulosa TaxID=1464011 RepID=UPI0036A17CD8
MTGTQSAVTGVDASWAQNGTLTFTHALTGADRAYERVTAVPALVIPRAGLWVVDYSARGVASMPASVAGAEFVSVALYKNGSVVTGTEVMVVGSNGAGTGAQATGGLSFVHTFAAVGDTLELWACRIGQLGTASVVSNGDGRTRIVGHWIGPPGDTPA